MSGGTRIKEPNAHRPAQNDELYDIYDQRLALLDLKKLGLLGTFLSGESRTFLSGAYSFTIHKMRYQTLNQYFRYNN